MQNGLQFFFAFVVVLVLIGAAAWLARRFTGSRLGSNANRGRMPRLAVIDAAAVDGRRRLVLVRRDNVEHLLMIGGPTDIVVEPNIVRAVPPREQVNPRAVAPLGDASNWTETEAPRAESLDHAHTPALPEMPPPPPRPTRTAFPDEPRRAPPPPERRAADPLADFIAESPTRVEPSLREPALREPSLRESAPRESTLRETPPRSMPRAEPLIPRPSARPAEPPAKAPPPIRPSERPAERPAAASSADQNLAEMAQRLEAALRRPSAGANDAAGSVAPPVAPEAPSARPSRLQASEPAQSRSSEPRPESADAARAPFKNLEDEMASLLGRPKTPT